MMMIMILTMRKVVILRFDDGKEDHSKLRNTLTKVERQRLDLDDDDGKEEKKKLDWMMMEKQKLELEDDDGKVETVLGG